jgi:homoserine dehydrogenase
MASITSLLADKNIGIESIVQKDSLEENLVPIILVTDLFDEQKLEKIKSSILALESVNKLRTIRIESI